MTYEVLKIVFYVLLCLPVLVLGIYFFVSLCKDIFDIKKSEKKEKEIMRMNAEKKRSEDIDRQLFYKKIDERRGSR